MSESSQVSPTVPPAEGKSGKAAKAAGGSCCGCTGCGCGCLLSLLAVGSLLVALVVFFGLDQIKAALQPARPAIANPTVIARRALDVKLAAVARADASESVELELTAEELNVWLARLRAPLHEGFALESVQAEFDDDRIDFYLIGSGFARHDLTLRASVRADVGTGGRRLELTGAGFNRATLPLELVGGAIRGWLDRFHQALLGVPAGVWHDHLDALTVTREGIRLRGRLRWLPGMKAETPAPPAPMAAPGGGIGHPPPEDGGSDRGGVPARDGEPENGGAAGGGG